MANRFLFEISDRWALGCDKLQWMLLEARNRRGEREWHHISFIASEKQILERCIREHGVYPTLEAQAKLNALPGTFKEWLGQQNRREVAL